MKFVRPRSLTLAFSALLISASLAAQNPPPQGRGRGQGGPPDSMQGRPGPMMGAGQGQGRGRGMGGPGDDFGRFLFPPDMVMQHQREIGLTDAQKTLIVGATQKLESDVVAFSWKLTDEQQKLTDLVQATPIDSTATLAQIDKVLDLERQIKRAHVAALVRIKNTLTADQQRTLRALEPPGMREMLHLDYGPAGRGRGGRGDGREEGT